MEMDTEKPSETHVFVHSPLIEHSINGDYYTSYAISLMSTNPCFSHRSSHTRRRYSEFIYLRRLLAAHHLNVKTPALPPKNFFYRFNPSFIEERIAGLQKFLDEVLSIPVYLSDKSLHLFLQSSCSMSQIDEKCLGDIPPPQLLDTSLVSSLSDSSSIKSSEYQEAQSFSKALKSLVIDSDDSEAKIQREFLRTKVNDSMPHVKTATFRQKYGTRPCDIPKRHGSLDSSPASSLSSSDTSYSSSLDRMRERHVSFNDKVKVAVVTCYGIAVQDS